MEIRHLKQLIRISQCGSINKASQQLYISQPSLNNIVKRCEGELGFVIFQRTPKGIKLTPNGVKFMNSAQKIVEEYKKIEELSCPTENSSISVSFIYLSYLLEVFLMLQEQGVLFTEMIRRTETEEIITDVVSRKVHLGFLPIYQSDLNYFQRKANKYNLQYTKLFDSIQMFAVVGRDHPLATKKFISIKDTEPFPITYYMTVPVESRLKNIYNSKASLKVQNRDELFLALKGHRYFSLLTLTASSKNPEFCYIPIIDNGFKMNLYAISLIDTRITEQEFLLMKTLKSTLTFLSYTDE